MSNVLDEEKPQQILALGRLGWSLRRIDAATGVRRETIDIPAAGIGVRGRGRRGEQAANAPLPQRCPPTSSPPNPAMSSRVSSDPGGRNAVAIYQDLVDDHGFTAKYASVRRFVVRLRGVAAVEARVVIRTAPGEDYGESPVMVSSPAFSRCPSVRRALRA